MGLQRRRPPDDEMDFALARQFCFKFPRTKREFNAAMESDDAKEKRLELIEQLTEELASGLLNKTVPFDVVDSTTGELIIPANRNITMTVLRNVARAYDRLEIDPSPSPLRDFILDVISRYECKLARTRYGDFKRSGSGRTEKAID
jgi:hypothetical protein